MAVRQRRIIGLWLLAVAAMVAFQVTLGGITRLTDSGLSITEWQPLLGVIPPTNEAAWLDAFGKYKQIPQFEAVHAQMQLGAFKFIYFWEWMHRLWGRLLGFAFAIPLGVFLARGWLRGLWPRFVILLLVGGLQGALGWYMVTSGLSTLIYVSHIRLALHFIVAIALFAALVWNGLDLRSAGRSNSDAGAFRCTVALSGLLAVQLVLGALTAGLKAALAAVTWPTVNGFWWIPVSGDWWNQALSVQFLHRCVAYTLAVASVFWWLRCRRLLRWEATAVLAIVGFQVVLGIATVLRAPFAGALLLYGTLHQATAVALVALLTAASVALAPAPRFQK